MVAVKYCDFVFALISKGIYLKRKFFNLFNLCIFRCVRACTFFNLITIAVVPVHAVF